MEVQHTWEEGDELGLVLEGSRQDAMQRAAGEDIVCAAVDHKVVPRYVAVGMAITAIDGHPVKTGAVLEANLIPTLA